MEKPQSATTRHRMYLLRLARLRNRLRDVLSRRAEVQWAAERAEAEARPLSFKAKELLNAAGHPPVSDMELALVELLRVALEAIPEAPAEAFARLELCDELIRRHRFLAAYKTLVGFPDSADEPAWDSLQEARTFAQGLQRVVKLASGAA